ncbi:pyrroline-5-carboxylate reductase [Paucilactobacillus suebicus]|uniref:Pyrroline-5-carboxylate reductase n=1 Tax=Paucilactobacillus suebicus DSM 5007 = KCTC 3549 TaxID=1423807 RepID=A0A0R1W277_9LACO|nr:pyrroline-5-carboxylate reductase [Paucilactobacillus suebicus]KRM11666.1 pyrroline-5-carboxylate reductase [Paucilactobacillus suebicus DSM 5007 = KCTC 3549]
MKIGFIGVGEMAQAIIKGLINANQFDPSDIYVHSTHQTTYEPFAKETGVVAVDSNIEVAKQTDIVVLAVIPNAAVVVLNEIKSQLADKTLISIIGSLSVTEIENVIGTSIPILRALPNINVEGNVGMTALADNDALIGDKKAVAVKTFEVLGEVSWQQESKFAIFSAIAGSGPAYVDFFIDALSRAGVKYGLTKKEATEIAAMTLQGSSHMVLNSKNQTPMDFVDAVCSPGGSTVAGLLAMEEAGFMNSVIKGIDATVNR